MRATRVWTGEAGESSESEWSDVKRLSGAAAVSQLATRPGRAALDAAAPFSATPPFHQHRDAPQAPVVDAPIQSGTSIRPHSALDVMTKD
jgi:hypothetical protein